MRIIRRIAKHFLSKALVKFQVWSTQDFAPVFDEVWVETTDQQKLISCRHLQVKPHFSPGAVDKGNEFGGVGVAANDVVQRIIW